MTQQLVEDALGDPGNAQTLAHAADLAYLPGDQGKERFRSEMGMEAQFFSHGNTQAYVAHNDDHVLVAFRGTEGPETLEGLKDWLLTDAANLLMVPEGRLGTDLAAAGVGALFHQGFVNALADIWEPVNTAVEAELKKQDRPLWITGHSLGGALALLAAWMFQRKMISVHQVYTFGAPMIGNLAAAEAFDRELTGKIFRYVNSDDPVPCLPTMSLVANNYGHCQKEIVVGAVTAVEQAAAATAGFFKEMASKTVDGVLNGTLIDDIWKGLQTRVGAHAMENYRNLIATLFKK